MDEILLNYKKLLATIKNVKNNKNHIIYIRRFINIFDRFHRFEYEEMRTDMVKRLNHELDLVSKRLYSE
tara:strand:- start:396 stop:602 length:207 start_codon:yes stop_codon:yes gene_type:complete